MKIINCAVIIVFASLTSPAAFAKTKYYICQKDGAIVTFGNTGQCADGFIDNLIKSKPTDIDCSKLSNAPNPLPWKNDTFCVVDDSPTSVFSAVIKNSVTDGEDNIQDSSKKVYYHTALPGWQKLVPTIRQKLAYAQQTPGDNKQATSRLRESETDLRKWAKENGQDADDLVRSRRNEGVIITP